MTITSNHIAEFSALVVSIIFWKDIRTGNLRWLPAFLVFILCIELTGTFFKKTPYANAKLYNFSIPLEYLFYHFLFWLHGEKILKRFALITEVLLILLAMFYFIAAPFNELHDNVLVFGQLSVIVCCCIYLYKKFQTPDDDHSLLEDHFFWILAGLLIFNLEDFTYFFLLDIIRKNNWDKHDGWFKAINGSLIILLYAFYIVSILVYRKRKNIL